MLRWSDAWLKGVDNGVKSEVPVRIFVMGSNQWVDEQEWPMTRTRYTEFYLHSSGRANFIFGVSEIPTKFEYR
jgi:predicted acyl esterase